MNKLYSIPPTDQMVEACEKTPTYMVKNSTPYCVVYEGFLSAEHCDLIIEHAMKEESYSFAGCGAITREAVRPLSCVYLGVIDVANEANDGWFGLDLYPDPGAWLQTYEMGDSYSLHVDNAPGQSRKLTSVVLLTDPSEYEGGDLQIVAPPNIFQIPRTRGTIVTFPSWIYHQVTTVESGIRQSLNLGYWGPPFK